jgi:type IV pilus assembly protein PilA
MIMKKQRNNKGFTLVELIVVMAIMAILIGALAPQVVKYVEQARESKDMQVVSTVFTAVQTAIASSETTVADITQKDISTVIGLATVGADVKDLLGYATSVTADDVETGVEAKLKSKKGIAGNIYITYVADTGALTVYVAESTALGTVTLGSVTN